MGDEVAAKETLGLVIIGHIDAGKSTLCGRLLVENGGIDKRTMGKLEQEAVGMGRSSFKYAFAMDLTKAERSRGITINATVKCFETKRYKVTIVDAPGHKDFIKNMITGTSSADAGILVIDGTPGGFEAGISAGGQTRQHAQLAFASGVTALIVAVNKMDAVNEADQEERFRVITNEIASILKSIGYYKSADFVPFVPISAFCGMNIGDPATCFPWKKSWNYKVVRKDMPEVKLDGVTLIDAIDSVVKPPSPVDFPLRGCITDSFRTDKAGTVASVSVNYGKAETGMNVKIVPCQKITMIRSIEVHREAFPLVTATCCAGMTFKNTNLADLKRGSMIGPIEDPPHIVKQFTCRLAVLDHPTKICIGYAPVVDASSAHVPCKLTEILKVKASRKHNEMITDSEVKFITVGDQAEVVFEPKGYLFIEALPNFPRYTRMSVRDMGKVIAIGSCIGRVVDQSVDKAQKAALEKAAKAKKIKAGA